MTIELALWLAVCVVGLLVIPLVYRRRRREHLYVKMVGSTVDRALILQERTVRAFLLCLAVLCGAVVAFGSWLGRPPEVWRIVAVGFLITVMVCVVAVLIIDEWYADRMQGTTKGDG